MQHLRSYVIISWSQRHGSFNFARVDFNLRHWTQLCWSLSTNTIQIIPQHRMGKVLGQIQRGLHTATQRFPRTDSQLRRLGHYYNLFLQQAAQRGSVYTQWRRVFYRTAHENSAQQSSRESLWTIQRQNQLSRMVFAPFQSVIWKYFPDCSWDGFISFWLRLSHNCSQRTLQNNIYTNRVIVTGKTWLRQRISFSIWRTCTLARRTYRTVKSFTFSCSSLTT